MIILGLGSNVGDRLLHLRKAWQALQQLPQLTIRQVSPIYLSDALLPDHAPPTWNQPYLNLALRCDTTQTPFTLLKQLKQIEQTMGRQPEKKHWGPREIDIDLLAWDDFIIQNEKLHLPQSQLPLRPFALWPLADVAPLWVYPLAGAHQGKTAAQLVESWGSRFTGEAPYHTRQIAQRIDTPRLVGILNITPDSFSDGGQWIHTEKALQQALALVRAGAEVLDIGAESTAPTATALTPEKEWQRLEPILIALKQVQAEFLLPPTISIDTRHVDVAEKSLDYGVHWINDVTGLDDPRMRQLIAHTPLRCVIMHHLSIPEKRHHVLPRHRHPLHFVYEWGEKRLNELLQDGITPEQMIFDPGIGFGKRAEQSLLLLKQVTSLSQLGVPLLLGHSRKSFLSLLSAQPSSERDIETTATSLYLAKQGVDYLRVHSIDMVARALKVMAALES
jgi:2-amino-4-hydroxy-6-hydroxymethyldihydropteridine diphosphokinase / dihydropteroate synthase